MTCKCNEIINVKVKRIHEGAVMPEFAHDTDTGFDLFTCEDLHLDGLGKGIAKTGLIFELPNNWGIQIRNKSGMTIKGVPCHLDDVEIREDITVYLGTIDSNYVGEVGIMVKNESPFDLVIPKHTKLAQGVLEKVYQCNFTEVNEINETDRGNGGFGSTGARKEVK